MKIFVNSMSYSEKEFKIGSCGFVRFFNNHPFDNLFEIEVYIHENADLIERMPLFEISRNYNIDYVRMKTIVKK